VQINSVKENNDTSFITVNGKIQASKSADLSTRLMGFVNKIHINVGDNVKKGQLLLTIKNSELQAKLAQVNAKIIEAKAAYKSSEKNYKRFKNLFSQKSASEKELDDVSTQFEMSKARLKAAKEMQNEVKSQFEYVNIIAPFSGVITSKNIQVGDMANPGIPLISIENQNNLEVLCLVPESEITKIKEDVTVNINIKSIQQNLKGKVIAISKSSKNTGSQFLVKVAFNKGNATILSGMFASVSLPIKEKTTSNNTILIPLKALVKKGQLTGIYTKSETNKALLRWVRIGKKYGNQVEVLSGLSKDESYIISSEGKLYNGANISIQ
jgi:RND family efflux transporter MFP subunit